MLLNTPRSGRAADGPAWTERGQPSPAWCGAGVLLSEALAEEESRGAESCHPDVVLNHAWVWPEWEACVFKWLSLEVNVNEMLTQMKTSEA